MTDGYGIDYIFLKESMTFTIDALKPHWALKNFDLYGDSMVIFRGLMKIKPEERIDIRELKRNTILPKGELLHFIIEHFGDDIEKGVLRQNILVTIAEEKLANRLSGRKILRWADDLFDEDRRLTLTAVAQTPVSVKLHLGVAINSDTEAGFIGVDEYGLDIQELGEVIGNQYRADMKRMLEKCWRMRPIF